jgi:chromosomal replication initiation ATPase DnaA
LIDMENTKSSQQTPQGSGNPQLFGDAQVFWDLILEDLALQMTQAAFDAWLQPTRVIGLADGVLSVQVPNERIKEWLEHRLWKKIRETVDYYASAALEIRFVADSAHREIGPVRCATRFPDQNAQQLRRGPRATPSKGGTALRKTPGRPKAHTHTTQ